MGARTVYENQIIDWFLTELAKGTRPHSAAQRAGATLRLLQSWAAEDTDEARIFAEQWENAEALGNDVIEQHIRDLAFVGQMEYVTTKDGVVTEYDPVTKTRKPLVVYKRSEAMLKLLAQSKITEFMPKTAASRANENQFSTDEVVNDRAPIDADEPGPANPIL